MKSYTDIKQSEKLMEILPPESVDMKWHFWKSEIDTPKPPTFGYSKDAAESCKSTEAVYLPCWSQAALYEMLPVTIGNLLEKNALRLRMDKSETDFNVLYDNLDTGSAVEDLDVVESNPVDAYYEIIIKLHERKFI